MVPRAQSIRYAQVVAFCIAPTGDAGRDLCLRLLPCVDKVGDRRGGPQGAEHLFDEEAAGTAEAGAVGDEEGGAGQRVRH